MIAKLKKCSSFILDTLVKIAGRSSRAFKNACLWFDFAKLSGSQANDQLSFIDGKIKHLSNNNGGINGGISNGEDITISVAVKPTPSIGLPQKTVDLVNKENCQIEIKGRHDSCIVPRAVVCVESALIIALVDELLWKI